MQALADRRAARGAAWLDGQHSPEWAWKVDLQWLDMRSARRCVRGQLYGDFWWGPIVNSVTHGFATITPRGYRQLDQAWTREILNRRAARSSGLRTIKAESMAPYSPGRTFAPDNPGVSVEV